ncbi:ribonuclease T2 [Lindgomyces ingoldianus]|uniref:Ribonuclease T2 n=1 Tax=Lindgomyces ingoldianus TaxID=673940 RepID=A0ACB6QKA2_9PLEO|nr:ribonuclease T2 [Lindgomyces ingoldianus]KAF2467449.1 ribonuclease T2 [Lindgomyces ingoldianus]
MVGGAVAQLYPGQSPVNHTCLLQPSLLSCPPQNPSIVDSCCTETFGGLLLSTQFWSTYTNRESSGQLLPQNSWTLHGLWPDFCNGSFTQYCDLSRQYDPIPSPNTTDGTRNGTKVPPYTGPDIGTFVKGFGRYDLLDYMNTYWIAQNQENSGFWGHEFSKHATCFSTFNTACYGPKYVQHSEVVDFFETAVQWYKKVPTYKWLRKEGIVPSNTTTYSYKEIAGVLGRRHGAVPYVGCTGQRWNNTEEGRGGVDSGFTVLSEVWYYDYAYGRPQDGKTVPVNATGSQTNCAKVEGAIRYYERTKGSERTPRVPY